MRQLCLAPSPLCADVRMYLTVKAYVIRATGGSEGQPRVDIVPSEPKR